MRHIAIFSAFFRSDRAASFFSGGKIQNENNMESRSLGDFKNGPVINLRTQLYGGKILIKSFEIEFMVINADFLSGNKKKFGNS